MTDRELLKQARDVLRGTRRLAMAYAHGKGSEFDIMMERARAFLALLDKELNHD